MLDMKYAMFLCLNLYLLGAATSVSFIDPCHWQDSECILKSSKKALPYFLEGFKEWGMPSMNPLVLETVNGDTGELKMSFKNMTVEGLPKCQFIKIERPEKLKIHVELKCPIIATGQYDFEGKLFVLPIYGHGAFKIDTDEIFLAVTVDLKQIEKDGEKYYKFAKFDYKYEPVSVISYDFKELFGGDKTKAEPVLAILTDRWREVISTMGQPIIKEMLTQVVHTMEKVFLAVPCKELELE